MSDSLLRTPLYECHVGLGAKMVPFGGWEMPVQYEGIVSEHQAVREKVGLFDISHMGQIVATGPGVDEWVDHLLTNRARVLEVGFGQYTLMLNHEGGVIDDLLIYRVEKDAWSMIVNASKIQEDWDWMNSQLVDGISLVDYSDQIAAMAIQGPDSVKVYEALKNEIDLPLPERNGIAYRKAGDGWVTICRTGYTGEDGFEFLCSQSEAVTWWTRFHQVIQSLGGKACGLGARDTLRLEMGYPLNGQDLLPDRTPYQAGLGIFLKMKKPFVGRDVLRAEKAVGPTRRLAGFIMQGKTPPPRHGYPICVDGEEVSEITSGALSPTLGVGIGMGYLPTAFSEPGTQIEISIRGKRYPAEVVKTPFYRKG